MSKEKVNVRSKAHPPIVNARSEAHQRLVALDVSERFAVTTTRFVCGIIVLVLVNEFGVKINVIVVPYGARLGGDRFGVNRDQTVVEFYDTRTTRSFPPFGQFICRLPLDKVIASQGGLQLKLQVPEWKLSQMNIEVISSYLNGIQTP